MRGAFIPSPSHALWSLGPIAIRGYALCVIAGIVVAIWVAGRRYERAGGQKDLILQIAVFAVPAGLVGARLWDVLTDPPAYLGGGHDWVTILRIWDGGLGLPGAVVAAGACAWAVCRRAGARLPPVAGAAAPALAFGEAVAQWGSWFNQNLYGGPASVPWAVEITPAHRAHGYANFVTFQPTFLYQSLWSVLTGVLVIWAARRFTLTGDRIFAVFAGLAAAGAFWTAALRIGYAPHLLGLRVNQLVMLLVLAGSVIYLYLTRKRRGPDVIVVAGRAAIVPTAGGSGAIARSGSRSA